MQLALSFVGEETQNIVSYTSGLSNKFSFFLVKTAKGQSSLRISPAPEFTRRAL